MRACVTGATNFIGRALARRLLAGGRSVRALVEPSEHADNLRALGVELASANLEDRDSVEEVLNGTDVLYHTAETNLEGTQNIFEACIRRGVPHVVYLSSIAVYGFAQKGEVIDENTPYDPHFNERDDHSRAKIEADQYAVAIIQDQISGDHPQARCRVWTGKTTARGSFGMASGTQYKCSDRKTQTALPADLCGKPC